MPSSVLSAPLRRPLLLFLGAVGIVLSLLGLIVFRNVALLALAGTIVGVLLAPVIRWLRFRCRVPHGIGVSLIVILLVGGLGGLGYGIYALVAGQAGHLVEQGPVILDKLNQRVDVFAERFSWLGLDKDMIDPGAFALQAVGAVLKGLNVGVAGLASVLAGFMIAIFVAANYEGYARGALSLFPPQVRKRVNELGHSCALAVRRWFFSQIAVVSVSGTLTAVTMAVLGIEYWLLIAILTVFLDFIPFIGALITGLIAALLTLGTEPDKVWWVLLAYVVIQQLESDVVLPLIMKGTIRLPEAHLLVFILVMGTAFGVVGVFVAAPLFAVLHTLYREAYVPWIEGKRSD